MTTSSAEKPSVNLCQWRKSLLAVGLFTVLAVAGGGVFLFVNRHPPGPEIPSVEWDTIDPEAAAALRDAQTKVRQNAQSAEAWGQLGAVLFAHGLHAQAQICLTRAETINARDPRWPYYLGIIRLERDPDLGIACLQRTIDRAPNEVSPRLRLAEALLSQGRLEEAEVQ